MSKREQLFLVSVWSVESIVRTTSAQFMRRHAATTGRRGWFAGLPIMFLASLVYIPVAYASCRLEAIAEFHVDLVGNSPIIDGQINGRPIRILLETGSPISYITHTAARQLDLPIRSRDSAETAVVKELKIGELLLKDHAIYVVGSAIHDAEGVATFLLGADILALFPTEWDLANRVVRLLHPQDCELAQFAYWSTSYFQTNLEPLSPDNRSLFLEVKINGKSTRARLVSGSATSEITPEAAREAGIELGGPNALPAEDITGLTAKPTPTWIGRFDTFEVGGETIKNARLLIGEVFPKTNGSHWANSPPVRAPANIALGADFLQANHLIIVPAKHVALFTYNGGPVFQLKRPD